VQVRLTLDMLLSNALRKHVPSNLQARMGTYLPARLDSQQTQHPTRSRLNFWNLGGILFDSYWDSAT
jgi:hypothetical protein